MEQFLSWLTGLLALLVPGFGVAPAPSWNGYVEADYVYVAAPSPGIVASLEVAAGDSVAAGARLFALNDAQQQALLRAAEARVAAAAANLENLMTGSRSEEVEVIRASLGKARADLRLAETTLARSEKLAGEGLAPAARVEQDRATLATARAQVAQLQAQLAVAELPARQPQQLAAEASLLAAEAEADKARADLADRVALAPQAGRVDRLFFTEGEMAGAGLPVVALLPEAALKVKFYIGEAERPAFRLGEVVAVACDGCAQGLTATLSYFAAEPQFTPPVIYSREERRRLSFLAEAVLEQPRGLHPGQPVTVRRLP